MKAIEWSERAKADLWEIGEYWLIHNPSRAAAIANRIDRAARFLAEVPQAGPALDRKMIRKWRVAPIAYVLIYRVTADAIEIVRIRHSAENWRDTP